MLGLLRPHRSSLSGQERQTVDRIHCTGCVAMRRFSWASSLSYAYEVDVLIGLLVAFGDDVSQNGVRRRACSAVPVLPRATLRLTEHLDRVVSAFAVTVGWAAADDHVADGDGRLGRLLRRTLTPHLEEALGVLGIEGGRAPDPRLLRSFRPDTSCWEQLARSYEPFVAGLWRSAFGASENAALICDRGDALADRLGRVSLLADLWLDREEDAASGRPNPLVGHPEQAASALAQVHRDLRELSVLVADGNEPFASALRHVFCEGTPRRIARQAHRKDLVA